ncbi:MAG: alpha/beta fold hydrolase [Caldilineaceae bacterium]
MREQRSHLLHFLCVLGLLALLIPLPVQAQDNVTCVTNVIVQAGDSLTLLAGRYYGDISAYSAIVAATNAKAAVDKSYTAIANPNVISQGWKLCIPGPLSNQAATTNVTNTDVASSAPTPAATATPTTAEQKLLDETDWKALGQSLTIANMRQRVYPGSAITIEQTLAPGVNYSRYIASYRSEGLKIYALLTVPNGQKPATGWPVIVFNHGYIPPQIYRTTERYVNYVDGFARNGYIVFKSDYRGHDQSEGQPSGGYGAPDYTVDVLNAVASLKKYADADPNRIGMWGHSMGGYITLRSMVITKDIKVGVIWGGVVGSYNDIMNNWHSPVREVPTAPRARVWRRGLTQVYGTPQTNPTYWNSISANNYLADLSGPLQLDHSVTDEEVPVEFSQNLYKQAQAAGKTVELYTYPGDNHNISGNFTLAMERSVAFFDKYLKTTPDDE